MKLYVVYDRDTGEVLHTHASYVLGSDDSVDASEDEIRSGLPESVAFKNLGIAEADGDTLSPPMRGHRLIVDVSTGAVRSEQRP